MIKHADGAKYAKLQVFLCHPAPKIQGSFRPLRAS
jgi:hypothetical protein